MTACVPSKVSISRDRQTDRQRQRHRQTDRERHTDRQTDRQTETDKDRQRQTETGRQTDRQRGCAVYIQINRQGAARLPGSPQVHRNASSSSLEPRTPTPPATSMEQPRVRSHRQD